MKSKLRRRIEQIAAEVKAGRVDPHSLRRVIQCEVFAEMKELKEVADLYKAHPDEPEYKECADMYADLEKLVKQVEPLVPGGFA